MWLRSHWLALERLLDDDGRQIVVIDNVADRNNVFAAERIIGAPPARIAALMRAAACVVGNDSGMVHVAGALGVPAVALCAYIPGQQIYSIYPTVRVIQGPLACSGCHGGGDNWRPACNTVCACLQAIQPEDVLAAVNAAAPLVDPPEPFPGVDRAASDALHARLARLTTTLPSFAGGVVDRRPTMTEFIRRFLARPSPVVVETGCQRGDDDYGAGMSTTLFADALAVAGTGGRLTSLELDPQRAAFARARIAGGGVGYLVNVVVTDSRAWLRAYTGPPIDALYLDSMDMEIPGYERCCLEEATLAVPHMADDGVILIDDTIRDDAVGWRGKGALAVPWLLDHDWIVAASGYQCLLVRRPS